MTSSFIAISKKKEKEKPERKHKLLEGQISTENV